jgi:hypothetical protein
LRRSVAKPHETEPGGIFVTNMAHSFPVFVTLMALDSRHEEGEVNGDPHEKNDASGFGHEFRPFPFDKRSTGERRRS